MIEEIRKVITAGFASLIFLSGQIYSDTVVIDLSGIAAGNHTLISAPGGNMGQVFQGQTAVDTGIAPPITPPSTITGIAGSPTSPLSISVADVLTVTKNPMLLPECGVTTPEWFQSRGIDGSPSSGPISVLLDSNANSITWNMGSGHGGSVAIDFFDSDGVLVHTEIVDQLPACYGPYTFSGFGSFRALTIYENSDRFGMAFWNFQYEALPPFACSGFKPPMESFPVKAKKNRVFPLKLDLYDEAGFELSDLDITASPVVQVLFTPLNGVPIDVTDDALSSGAGTEGNQFEYVDDGHWQFNLKSSNYTSKGEYVVTAVSGDESEYTIDPSCLTSFAIEH